MKAGGFQSIVRWYLYVSTIHANTRFLALVRGVVIVNKKPGRYSEENRASGAGRMPQGVCRRGGQHAVVPVKPCLSIDGGASAAGHRRRRRLPKPPVGDKARCILYDLVVSTDNLLGCTGRETAPDKAQQRQNDENGERYEQQIPRHLQPPPDRDRHGPPHSVQNLTDSRSYLSKSRAPRTSASGARKSAPPRRARPISNAGGGYHREIHEFPRERADTSHRLQAQAGKLAP